MQLKKKLQHTLCLLALLGYSYARADGPHWQVPDPGPLYTPDEGHKGNKQPPVLPPPPPDPKKKNDKKAAAKPSNPNKPEDYTPHVPDLLKLNDECVKWYEKHCVIKMANNDKKKFYLDIMARCAQAMREVDEYCPCPDSYPLWQTEELRDKMVKYAMDTWVKCCTELDKPNADACVQFCVDAYCDTIRFFDNKDLVSRNEELSKILNGMAEKGVLKGGDEFGKLVKGKWIFANSVKMDTFVFTTGDIPAVIETASSRMWQALTRMGGVCIPAIKDAMTRYQSAAVQKALASLLADLSKNR